MSALNLGNGRPPFIRLIDIDTVSARGTRSSWSTTIAREAIVRRAQWHVRKGDPVRDRDSVLRDTHAAATRPMRERDLLQRLGALSDRPAHAPTADEASAAATYLGAHATWPLARTAAAARADTDLCPIRGAVHRHSHRRPLAPTSEGARPAQGFLRTVVSWTS